MLELENLSGQEFYEILEALKKKIPIYAPKWTNLQASDPGITVLELMAWLDVIMHQYMSVLPDDTYYALMELLDIKPNKNKGSHTILSVVGLNQDVCVPQKSKWYSDNLVFENNTSVYLTQGDINKISFNRKKSITNVSCDELRLSGGISLFGDSKQVGGLAGNSFSICLTHCPKKGEWLKIYMELTEEKDRTNGTSIIPMSKIMWEYLGVDKNFHSIIEVENRDSCKGIISLKISDCLGETEDGYIIRATLEWEEFDFCPRVKSINLNSFEVEQRDTFCDNILIHEKDIINKEIQIRHYLATNGKILLYSCCENGFLPIEKFSVEYIEEQFITKIKPTDYSGGDLMVVLFSPKIEDKMIIGSTTQITNQTFELNISDVKEDDLELFVVTPNGVYQTWVSDNSLKKSMSFCYTPNDKTIRFGDNIRGYAPLAAKNSVRLSALSTTQGEQSNIKEGMINSSNIIKNGQIKQLTLARGGVNTETMEDLKAKVSRVFSQNQRAVTLEDYKNIVKGTPGLIIKNVKVINDEHRNHITVVVQGGGRASNQPLKCYKEGILQHLEQHRLIGTQIDIVWPQNIDLLISAEIMVSPYYRDSEQIITEAVETFTVNKEIGSVFHYSELYGKLEMLPCVERVLSLDIITNTNGVCKTQTDDIIIPSNGMYKLDELKIDLVKSNNI